MFIKATKADIAGVIVIALATAGLAFLGVRGAGLIAAAVALGFVTGVWSESCKP